MNTHRETDDEKYPRCTGCGEVFDEVQDIYDHDCPEADRGDGNLGELFG